ncbi:MAG: hypothetical protein ACR2QG_13730, partial [Gammaproteobacteria bacterium]
LYEVLTGEPLFHPDVTPDSVRNTVPQRVSGLVDGIPPELDRLVASLLEKQAFRRPPGMAAVRASIESILAEQPVKALPDKGDGSTIRPVSRKASSKPGPEAGFRPRRLQDKDTTGQSAWRLYAVLGSLAAVALGVIFLLPVIVDNGREAPQPEQTVAEPETPVVSPAEAEVGRELADAALAELLRLSDRLKSRGVELWGGSDWFTAVNRMAAGDEDYKKRDFNAATTAYREALALLEPLTGKVNEVLQSALADGEQALLDGNQRLAVERYELALAVEPGNLTAAKGKQRALQLDRVMKLVSEASAFEVAEDWQNSLEKYSAALDIDPEWAPAIDGRERVSGVIAGNAYQSAMSAGYTALAEQRYDTARSSFNAALKVRPGDVDARQALEQIENDQRLARVSDLNSKAQQRAAEEDWAGAVSLYQAVLAVDTSVTSARNGLAQSQQRLELDQRMRDVLVSPDRLSDTPVLEATRQLLDYARGISQPGPVLTSQITELDQMVRRAVVPVNVRFESDGQTEVVIYKVGRFAPFMAQSIELRPGVYTAVGVRSGYRDERLSFRVQPETAMQPVIIRCEDPI